MTRLLELERRIGLSGGADDGRADQSAPEIGDVGAVGQVDEKAVDAITWLAQHFG